MSAPFYSSPSKALAIDNCPRAYFWQYEAKAKPAVAPHALVFGSAFDEVWNAYLLGGQTMGAADTEGLFESLWAPVEHRSVKFSSRANFADLMAIGKALSRQIPQAWEASGFEVLVDRDGKPMVQRDLMIQLAPDHVHRMKIDLAVVTRDGRVGVVDNKTASAASPEDFVSASEQLLDYQIALDAIAASNDWDRVEVVGFWEAIKTKSSPRILPPNTAERRSEQDVRERLDKLRQQKQQVQAGVFPRTPRMAFNSPCSLCDFAKACLKGQTEGLDIPAEGVKKLIERGWLDVRHAVEAA